MGEWFNETTGAAVGGSGAALFLAEIARWWWRRLSRDRTEIVKDRAEQHLIERLQKERDDALTRADMAFGERNDALRRESEAISQVGRLESEINHLREQVAHLHDEVRRLIAQIAGRVLIDPATGG